MFDWDRLLKMKAIFSWTFSGGSTILSVWSVATNSVSMLVVLMEGWRETNKLRTDNKPRGNNQIKFCFILSSQKELSFMRSLLLPLMHFYQCSREAILHYSGQYWAKECHCTETKPSHLHSYVHMDTKHSVSLEKQQCSSPWYNSRSPKAPRHQTGREFHFREFSFIWDKACQQNGPMKCAPTAESLNLRALASSMLQEIVCYSNRNSSLELDSINTT